MKIVVTIEGPPKSGKTVMAATLLQFLEGQGHTVKLEGTDFQNEGIARRLAVGDLPEGFPPNEIVIRTERYRP